MLTSCHWSAREMPEELYISYYERPQISPLRRVTGSPLRSIKDLNFRSYIVIAGNAQEPRHLLRISF